MPTVPVPNTAHYFVTDEIAYRRLPSEGCAEARSNLRTLVGLSEAGSDVLFEMMLEIEGMVRRGTDRWLGLSATAFSKDRMAVVRQLLEGGFLVRKIIDSEDSHGTTVVYFLSPGVVA